MQTSTTSPAVAPIGRTDRPQVTPLSQIVAKLLQAPAPIAPQAQQPAPATSEPPARPDGRDIRLGSRVDIKV